MRQVLVQTPGRMSRAEGQRGKAVEGPGKSVAVTMVCGVWRAVGGRGESQEVLVHVGKSREGRSG